MVLCNFKVEKGGKVITQVNTNTPFSISTFAKSGSTCQGTSVATTVTFWAEHIDGKYKGQITDLGTALSRSSDGYVNKQVSLKYEGMVELWATTALGSVSNTVTIRVGSLFNWVTLLIIAIVALVLFYIFD